MEPRIRCGDWFYRKREQPDMDKGEVWSPELWCGDDWLTKRTDVVKIPSTKELMEFVATTFIDTKHIFPPYRITLQKWHDGYRADAWGTTLGYNERIKATGENLDAALYGLWEKMNDKKGSE